MDPGSGFSPSVAVCKEEESEQPASQQMLVPPGEERSLSTSATSNRVEFSVSLQTVYDEEALPKPSEAAIAEENEPEDEGGSARPSQEAVSAALSTALQTEMEIEEEVAASLRAELTASEPRLLVKEYDLVVRCEDQDVLLQFRTSAGRLFSRVYKVYANMQEVKEDLAAFLCCSMRDVELGEGEGPLAGVGVSIRIRVTQRAKPFLGGFRDSLSGLEFHHAESQTSARVSRDVQTVRTRRRRADTGQVQSVSQSVSSDAVTSGREVTGTPGAAARPLHPGSAGPRADWDRGALRGDRGGGAGPGPGRQGARHPALLPRLQGAPPPAAGRERAA